jgi:uncharacterized protein YgiM (DUF1202 family)
MIASQQKKHQRIIALTSMIMITSASLSLSPAQARPGFHGPGPGIAPIIQVGALAYLFVDGLFYKRGPKGYIVAQAPIGATITALPPGSVLVTIDGNLYYTCSGTFYQSTPEGYVVVSQPVKQVNPEVRIGQELLVTVDVLNVRSGPGLTFETVGQLTKHEVIRVEGLRTDWFFVRLKDGTTGWIKNIYTTSIHSGAKG